MTFATKYEFDTNRHEGFRVTHNVICAEAYLGSDGEGSVRFWLERRHPDKFNFETGESTPAHTETIMGRTLYSYALVQNKKGGYAKSDTPWLLRELVLTVARGDVGTKSSAEILWKLLAMTCVRKRDKWLQEGAPEWFALVDPKREEVKV